MSTQSPFGGRLGRTFPTLPKGETVASFETYAEAQAAVDTLAKAAFPVKELAIVGTDLTSVERITGTLSWGRAAGAGALSGAWFGTFLGLLFFIFAPTGASLGVLISAVLIGAGFGMIFSVVSYSINRRRRDFTSVMQVLATRYAIIAEPEHIDRARSVLGVDAPAPGPASPAVSPPGSPSHPVSYGEATDAARRAAAAAPPAESAPARERPRYGELAPTEAESADSTDAAASADSGSDDGAGAASSER
ncbi:general stress protein [Agromyces sp. Soil535]|uniref:general stress protein n=1 Tax=Agromyces sp. Soil535 TaxID=1736390 RepID=UPI000AA4C16E|nr:general stress protein [Agromyces sp. Soil535]